MSVKLILSFDSEDYETPESDDAELWWAQTLTDLGLRGCFCVVAEELRAVSRRGRRDVVEAWAKHEIASHTNLHSAHPTPAEYLDDLSALARPGAYGPAAELAEALSRLPPWEGGVLAFTAQEGPGFEELARAFGHWPVAWCKPGSSWGPQLCAALPRMGVPLFADAPLEWAVGQPLRYAGALMLGYHHSFDHYFGDAAGRLERMKADFTRLVAERRDGWVVMYTHPCRLVTSAFPDNFTAGRNPPRDEWRPAPLRPRAEVEALQADFRAFLRWVLEAGEVEPATYADVIEQHAAPAPWLTPDEVRELCAPDVGGPADPRRVGDKWLSPAEQLAALAGAALRGVDGGLAYASPLGPTEPTARSAPRRATRDELLAAARVVDGAPHVPAVVNGIGPQAFLAGLRQLVREGSETVDLPADPGDVAFALRTNVRFARTWSIFPPEFKGETLLALHRGQCWTAKPA